MRSHCFRLSVLVGAAFLTLSGRLDAQGFAATDVPYPVRTHFVPGALRRAYQEGFVTTYAIDQKLVVSWTASAIANQPPNWSLHWNSQTRSFGNNVAQTATQEFPVRYFPTACTIIGSDALVVAGVQADGKTVIEKWSLTWPSPMPAPAVEIGTGLKRVAVSQPTVSQVIRLYSADVVGRRIVRNLAALRKSNGPASHCLVHFDDSNDVYTFDISSAQLTLLASPLNASAPLGIVAGLSGRDQTGISFGNHVSAGYVYTFDRFITDLPGVSTATSPLDVIMLDANRDGAIDSVVQLAASDVAAQGWSNLANYIDWWLN